MLEITQNGNWYSVEIEYDGDWDHFRANGAKAFRELVQDLIHDCKIDEQFQLAEQLQTYLGD